MNKITIFLLLLFCMQISAFADSLSCKTGMKEIIALFTPKTVVCNDNQFLPADSLECSNCPSGYTCSGGSLVFNEKTSSGIDYTQKITASANNICAQNFPKMLYANFRIKEYVCNPGYYLPVGEDWVNDTEGCRICPANSYCVGGIYTFNETTAQGINPCPNNQTSLAGSSSVDQCKTVNLTWVSNGETYTTSTCTINGLITLPPDPAPRPGYTFTGWTVQKNNE